MLATHGAAEISQSADPKAERALEIMEVLLSSDPTLVDIPNHCGSTPLHYAGAVCESGATTPMWSLLVRYDANRAIRNTRGFTAEEMRMAPPEKDLCWFQPR